MSDDVANQGKGGAPGGFWLEIYKDMFQPAARVTGGVLEDLARTLNRSGLEFGAEGREHVRRFILRAKRGVPESQLAPPPPPILGRIVESVRYEPEGTPLYQMFERLLSSSMDSQRIHLVHPSFPVILGHLCSDEVKLLQALSAGDITGDWSEWADYSLVPIPQMKVPVEILSQPDAFDLYYANLLSLSLVIMSDEQEVRPAADMPPEERFRRRWILTLQDMGRHLLAACRSPSGASEATTS